MSIYLVYSLFMLCSSEYHDPKLYYLNILNILFKKWQNGFKCLK